ncbi:hypothetical protein AKJ57_03500 [candidate division MSBL1 archaeon SCGC-AAA259A05]|uniref:Uncharacterized protein n=1 Tax=candidate division MSBL1 archaeon SCGC-AAA259A05 TaxID=1698259 RepID=A0A133U9J4_9EURY|nr:hypothetical protein AKJ57_03500 [candidate division MSBL1 archaeon SCGC-AAA259A05]
MLTYFFVVKFIKNKNLPPKNPVESFKRDFEKLKDLVELKSKHFVIFNNKDIFQQDEKDKKSTKRANDRFEELENEFKKDKYNHREVLPRKGDQKRIEKMGNPNFRV